MDETIPDKIPDKDVFEVLGYRFEISDRFSPAAPIDINDPLVQKRLTELAELIKDIEERTGIEFDKRILINGDTGYAVQLADMGLINDPEAVRGSKTAILHVGTHGWLSGDFDIVEGILLHETWHAKSKNGIAASVMMISSQVDGFLEVLHRFIEEDPLKAEAWLIDRFGSLENAKAYIQHLHDISSKTQHTISPIVGKSDREILELLDENPRLLHDIVDQMPIDDITRLLTDEAIPFRHNLRGWHRCLGLLT